MNRRPYILPVAAILLAALAACPSPSDTREPWPSPATTPTSAAPTVAQPTTTRPAPPTTSEPVEDDPGRTKAPPQRRAPATTATAGETDPTEPVTGVGYDNCEEMRHDYPNGVDVTHPEYRTKFDRDRDGRACEID